MKSGVEVSTLVFLVAVFTVMFAFLISAAYDVTTSSGGTSFNMDEDVTFFYNISVNNTETGAVSNASQINITVPSTFTLLLDSNGTDAGTHTFTNTSTVYSWENDGLVMNLTQNYFWFNATAATPGTYNFTISVVNDTDVSLTNISVIVNDTTSPVITLLSPANALSTTTTSFNFTFNVSDASTVSDCILVFDGSIIHNSSSISTSETNGMYNSSFSVGAHNWSINCTDAAGNVGNSSVRTLTITAASSASSDDSTDSGGGIPTFSISQANLEKGYRRNMYENWKMSFNIGGKSHTLIIEDLQGEIVKLSVSSEKQYADLKEGDVKMFELTGDNIYDLSIEVFSVRSISSNLKPSADLLIKSISEPIQEKSGGGSQENVDSTATSPSAGEQAPSDSTSSAGGFSGWIIGGVLVIIAAFLVYWFASKKGMKK